MTTPEDPALEEALRRMAAKHHPSLQSSMGGKGFLAYGASAFCPGLGHLLAGYYTRAAIMFLITITVSAGFVASLIIPRFITALSLFLPLTVLVQFSQLIDAAYCGKVSTQNMLGDKSIRYLVGIAFFASAYFTQDAGFKYLQNNCIEICNCQVTNMAPTIEPTDYLLVNRHPTFTRWDMVLVNSPDPQYPLLIERIVGLPGEKIEITGDKLLVNDVSIPLPSGVDRYLPEDSSNDILEAPSPDNAGNGCWGRPITLGPDEYYVLGDNGPVSSDSRSWTSVEDHQPGALPRDQVRGRVVAIVWPTNRWRAFVSAAD